MSRTEDEAWMRLALAEARRGWPGARPNPMVGSVIVRDGECIATGFHARVGTAHAEVVALAEAGERARGADIYVSLEPCSHHGRTPPCADALIRAGVRRVVCGMVDPNPLVRGQGIERLRAAGIEVVVGVLEEECRSLNEDFLVYIAERRPFVTVKMAASLDGRVATTTGESQWITGPEARADVHRLREQADWILTGSGTLRADNPRLTARPPAATTGRTPHRALVSSGLDVDPDACLFDVEAAPTTVFCGEDANPEVRERLVARGVEVIALPVEGRGVSVDAVLSAIHARGALRLLVEAGPSVAGAFFDAERVDRLVLYYAPLVLGGQPAYPVVAGQGISALAGARRARTVRVTTVGADLRVEADFGRVDSLYPSPT